MSEVFHAVSQVLEHKIDESTRFVEDFLPAWMTILYREIFGTVLTSCHTLNEVKTVKIRHISVKNMAYLWKVLL